MRQWNRRCRGEADEVSRLQIPVQRFFQPEDVIGCDSLGEAYAAGDVIRCVHVQHEQHVATDRFAYPADPRDFVLQRQRTGLQLDRPVAPRDVFHEFIRILAERRTFDVVAAGGVGEDRRTGAAKQAKHR